jgi:hypothetical protein
MLIIAVRNDCLRNTLWKDQFVSGKYPEPTYNSQAPSSAERPRTGVSSPPHRASGTAPAAGRCLVSAGHRAWPCGTGPRQPPNLLVLALPDGDHHDPRVGRLCGLCGLCGSALDPRIPAKHFSARLLILFSLWKRLNSSRCPSFSSKGAMFSSPRAMSSSPCSSSSVCRHRSRSDSNALSVLLHSMR